MKERLLGQTFNQTVVTEEDNEPDGAAGAGGV